MSRAFMRVPATNRVYATAHLPSLVICFKGLLLFASYVLLESQTSRDLWLGIHLMLFNFLWAPKTSQRR